MRLTTRRIEGGLQVLLQVLLPRSSFRLAFVEKLLSLRLVSFELGNVSSKSFSLQLQRRIFGYEVVYLSLQHGFIGSGSGTNFYTPERQANE
jgi:hypothetical protein